MNLSLTLVFASSIPALLPLLEQAQQSVGVHSSGSQLSVSTIHLNSTLQHRAINQRLRARAYRDREPVQNKHSQD